MDARRTVVWLIGAGIVIGALSAFGDSLGIGGSPDFGWKQTAGVVVGAVLLVAGLAAWALRGRATAG